MGIKNMIAKAGAKAGNKVAKLAALSPEQLQEVENNREKYLSQMPDPTDSTAEELTRRLMAASSVEIFNAYLPQLKTLYTPIVKSAEYGGEFKPEYNIRYFNITKWVTDKNENSLEKLVNVYEVLSNEDCNIALIFNRKCDITQVYLAVTNTQNADNNVDVENFKERLINAIKGNFPGSELSNEGKGTPPCLKNDTAYSVATASNIPTEKSEKFISQTIEKLLDGYIPDNAEKEYTIILLATPILDVEQRKLKLAEFYSGLAPYASWTTDFHYTEQDSTNSSATVGVNVGASAGIQNGQNQSVTGSEGVTDNASQTQSDSVTDTTNSSTSTSENISTTETNSISGSISEFASVSGSAGFLGTGVSATGGLSATQGTSTSTGTTVGSAKTVTDGISKSVGKSIANTLGRAVSRSVATTTGVFKSTNFGVNFGANFARSSSVTATIGKNEGITQSYTNYTIKHALELLEQQMKRFEQSTALGMWDFAAYVLSEDQNVANNVAHSYVALTQGEESYMSQSAINLWRGDMGENSGSAKEICNYLRELRHPVFGLSPALVELDSTFNVYPSIVTATTSLSGKELAYSLNFPKKSVTGLPVIECTEFGRNIITYDLQDDSGDKLKLGQVFHMNSIESGEVKISKDSLASHTFITGSTGSGKSNTVYKILEKAIDKGIKFLVVEPAKGEYKSVFGADEVEVYGTNPEITKMLKINPFSFSKGIHILEHLDRLIEIFNVCWPMYAAMPAVLKSAVEKSYVDCGWNLNTSKNKYSESIFPTFSDVAMNVKSIIDSSDYDTENKGAYKGALITRLQSLYNGLNGMIFTQNEISQEELFDKNVIVDLSRVGSSETKSLIMGMLILKLQEYRMTSSTTPNAKLKHITVLEEAHNILKRTSTEQTTESANLIGKSVEMISNSIAEMRTYGEGFIIVDQAPALLDMAAIRNTNTKIIMRLPDLTDRQLVGKAANLNDDQITELAKLPCGVAALYQNEWVQPVLCKIDLFEVSKEGYSYKPSDDDVYSENDISMVKSSLLDFIMDKEIFRKNERNGIEELKSMVITSKLSSTIKCDLIEYLSADGEKALETLRTLVYDFLNAGQAITLSEECNDLKQWVHNVVNELEPSIKGYSKRQIDLVMALIIYEQSIRNRAYNDILIRFTEIYKNEGGVF